MPELLDVKNTSREALIAQAVLTLQQGGLVVFPTETVYGIGADATNQAAVDKLLQYKARREGKPLSIAVNSIDMARTYVEVNKTALNLYENFLPGPLTIVSKGLGKVARGVQSETGTLGVRIPDYSLVTDIVRALGKPITATSANASYKKRPYSIDDILNAISDKQKNLIDLIIDAGELPKNEPSTVVDTTLDQKVVLRQGDIHLVPLFTKQTHSPEETQQLGEELIKKYQHYLGYKSVIFALQGELGAGKTEFTKGVAEALGITDPIQSPTFIIEKEYSVAVPDDSHLSNKKPFLYHIDTWRLFEPLELEELGFINQVAAGNIFSIEWADKVTELFKRVSEDAVIVWIKIEHGTSETSRTITVSDYK